MSLGASASNYYRRNKMGIVFREINKNRLLAKISKLNAQLVEAHVTEDWQKADAIVNELGATVALYKEAIR